MIRWLVLLALALWLAVVVLLLAGYARAQGMCQRGRSMDEWPGGWPPESAFIPWIHIGDVHPGESILLDEKFRPIKPTVVPAWAVPVGHSHPVQVTPALVCAVQHAIRWKDEPWSERVCEAQSESFSTSGERWGFDPLQLFAMAIIESDLRLMVVREDRGALDIGEMAVRCKLGTDGRCTNKPVNGLTPGEVMRPWRNIEKGAEILATLHAGSLVGYNGGPNAREHGYPAKVAATMAALGGVEVRVKGARRRKLVAQITGAVRP